MDYNNLKKSGREAFIAGHSRDSNPVSYRTNANGRLIWDSGWEEESQRCKGIEIESGIYSGCDASAGDCPSCGH